MFVRSAARFPDQVAVVAGGRGITYQRLAADSAALARTLAIGTGPVGVSAADLACRTLAAWQAGRAICLDPPGSTAAEPGELVPVTGSSPAIRTGGGTIDHAELAAEVHHLVDTHGIEPADRLLHCVPHDIWWPGLAAALATGATLVLDPDAAEDTALRHTVTEQAVTVLALPADRARDLLAEPDLGWLRPVRLLLCLDEQGSVVKAYWDPAEPDGADEEEAILLLDSDRPPHVAPRTEAERTVAEVWATLLDVDNVGATDNFFQLGGYSLLLTELADRLRTAAGVPIVLADLYTAPSVADQARLLDHDSTGAPPIQPVPRADALPVSLGQRRLWLLHNVRPDNTEWTVPMVLRLPPEIDVATVRRALDALAERHEVLRTRYLSRDGEPVQVIDPPSPVELTVADPGAEVDELVRERLDTGFDLATGPVWRALLAEPGKDRLLLITIHHIACDGWSATVLEREFRELCAAFQAGREPELPPVVVQYADYAVWQRQWRDREALAAELSYWRDELSELTPLELATDFPRPPERDPRGGLVAFTVPATTVRAMTALGQQHQATPFVTALTAVATLLARHTGQWDVPIGVPVAGRTSPELGAMVGFFLNSLVLRGRLAPALTFEQALDRLNDTCLSGFAHQELSFAHLVEELRPERDSARTPLYQVAFNYNDEQVSGGTADAALGEVLLRNRRVAKTDLTLYLWPQGGGWTGVFEYATALFRKDTVERLAANFVRLLGSIVRTPGQPLSTLDMVGDAERRRLAVEWNSTAVSWPDDSVLDLVEAKAAATPDALAVSCGAQRLTYRELDERANRIAHQLREHGLGQDGLVGICLNRGAELLACLLGVWKAGAAYVPLDPTNPAERLGRILTGSGISVLLSESAVADRCARYHGPRLLIDQSRAAIAAQPATAPDRTTDPERLAYVIYTSGSTGRPKGVMITHRGLANHLRWAAAELCAGPGGAALFSSVAFDLPLTNLFTPLITGRPVHLLPADLELTNLGRELAALAPLSFVKLTPGHLELLRHQLTAEQAGRLADQVLVAGEALGASLANHWLDLLGPGRLINEYGPTEASIGSTIHPVDAPQDGIVPLGSPLPNTTAYVLDERGNLAPVGVSGELCVGGTGVARGYLGQPGLTASRFRPDQCGPPGARLYHTGDLVRRNSAGIIEFLGRMDDQVKIRGYRIELGEIEAALRDHPVVMDAVVTAEPNHAGERMLAAYLVAETQLPSPDELRAWLADRLPDYMIPAAVLGIDRIPLTANGKIDHRALPASDGPATDAQAPRTPTEERIAEIWHGVLGQDNIGVDANFFALGGHSILAIQLTAQLQDEFDITLPIRTVFERPTIRQLADWIETQIRAEIEQLSDSELLKHTTTANEDLR